MSRKSFATCSGCEASTAKTAAAVSAASGLSFSTSRAARPTSKPISDNRRASDALMPGPAPMIKARRYGKSAIDSSSVCDGGTRRSELRPTPVDRKFGAGRKGRNKRKKEDGLCDFLRRTEPLHGIGLAHLPGKMVGRFLIGESLADDRCFDGTG